MGLQKTVPIELVSHFWNIPKRNDTLLAHRKEKSMKIGYVRISPEEQNTSRQELMMKELNVEKVFIDKISGKNTERPQLKEMMSFVRTGDTVVVESISRFARNTKDLLSLVEELDKKNVAFVSKKEAIDTKTPAGKFMLTVFAAISELEVSYLQQRQSEGIAIAKAKGVYKGRKPITHPDFEKVVKIWRKGEITAVEAMRRLEMKSSTFYNKVKEYEKKNR